MRRWRGASQPSLRHLTLLVSLPDGPKGAVPNRPPAILPAKRPPDHSRQATITAFDLQAGGECTAGRSVIVETSECICCIGASAPSLPKPSAT